MARWRPGARDRLQQAALDLFAAQGFEQTSVAQIAEAAGLTTRTFFRHFADKKEVLFGDAEEAPAMAERAIADAPAELSPLQVIDHTMRTLGGSMFDQPIDFMRQRRAIAAADPALRERELRKLADLADAIAAGFRTRGLDRTQSLLASELAVTVFKISLQRLLDTDNTSRAPGADLPSLGADTLQRLRDLR